MENYSLSDIASAIGNNGAFGSGGGSAWIIILFLFAMMGGGGFWGNQRNFASQSDVQNGFNFNELQRQFGNGISTTQMAQDHILQAINDQTFVTMSELKDNANLTQQVGFNLQEGICGLNRNIDSVRYDNALNTASVVSAIKEDGEKTRALMNENIIQNLRDKVNELSLAQSQCCQNSYLTNILRPYPNPSYIVSSPYVGVGVGVGTTF